MKYKSRNFIGSFFLFAACFPICRVCSAQRIAVEGTILYLEKPHYVGERDTIGTFQEEWWGCPAATIHTDDVDKFEVLVQSQGDTVFGVIIYSFTDTLSHSAAASFQVFFTDGYYKACGDEHDYTIPFVAKGEIRIQNDARNSQAELSQFSLRPNPTSSSGILSYSMPISSEVEISLHDLLGRKIITLFQGFEQQGNHSFLYSANDFPAGIYFVRFRAQTGVLTSKLIVLRN